MTGAWTVVEPLQTFHQDLIMSIKMRERNGQVKAEVMTI